MGKRGAHAQMVTEDREMGQVAHGVMLEAGKNCRYRGSWHVAI
jgi:hypothetical protein